MNSQPRAAAGHEGTPVEDSCYTLTGLQADLRNPSHYPVEANCSCGQVIKCESIRAQGWSHTGRRAGE